MTYSVPLVGSRLVLVKGFLAARFLTMTSRSYWSPPSFWSENF